MATLAHLTLIFAIPGPKRATVGVDFESNLAFTQATLQDMINRAGLEWNAGGVTLKQFFPAAVILDAVENFAYDRVANPNPPPPFRRQIALGPLNSPVQQAGTHASTFLTPQVALVTTLKTIISSRRTRGRVYWPLPPANQVTTNGVINSVYRDNFEAAVQNFFNAIEQSATPPQTFTHSVVSLQVGAGLVTQIIEYVVKNRVDTQRRRLVRGLDTPF